PHSSIFTLFPYTTLFRSVCSFNVEIRSACSSQLKAFHTTSYPSKPFVLPINCQPPSTLRCLNPKITRDWDGLMPPVQPSINCGQDRKSTRLNSSHRTISY